MLGKPHIGGLTKRVRRALDGIPTLWIRSNTREQLCIVACARPETARVVIERLRDAGLDAAVMDEQPGIWLVGVIIP
jgi:hypothetical protein